jgi:hypothetical protein
MRQNHMVMMTVMVALAPTGVRAREYKVETLKEGPPAVLSDAIKGAMSEQGYRVVDGEGNTYAEFWLRKAIPASGKPSGPREAVLYPILAEGELLGALRFPGEGHDYRDQTIAQGAYTLRYGLQPVNGDHLGVSPFRDFALLLPAAKDTELAPLAQKELESVSAEAAGTSHPAVLMLIAPPESASTTEPTMVHDQEKDLWGVVIPLSLDVQDASGPMTLPVQLIVVGAVAA